MFSKNRFEVLSQYSNAEIAKMTAKKQSKEMDPPIEVKSPEEIQRVLEARSSTKDLGNAVWSSMSRSRQPRAGDERRVSFRDIPEVDSSSDDLEADSTKSSPATQYGSFGFASDDSGAEPIRPKKDPRAPTAEELARSEAEFAALTSPSSVSSSSTASETSFDRPYVKKDRRRPPTEAELAAANAEFEKQFGSGPRP